MRFLAITPLFLALVAPGIAACSGGSDLAPTQLIGLKPTPIVVPVKSAEEAAALVLASDPQFHGIEAVNPDIVGASAWWTAEAIADGGYRITITRGWGDCPAGCISRHTWVYSVTADGQVTLESEAGDPMPAGTLPPG